MYWPDFSAAFLLGLAGGLHCVGMCGGIVMALTLGSRGPWWPGVATYHATRITSYAILGALAGAVGGAGTAMGAQKGLSVAAGFAMVIFAFQLGGFIPESFFKLPGLAPPAKYLRKAANGKSITAWGVVGFFNGLLPCGLVYAALALALNSGNGLAGAILLVAFGLGTAPSLLGVAAITKLVSPRIRGVLLKAAAVALALFGLFMIVKVFVMTGHHGAHPAALQHGSHQEIQPPSMTPWNVSITADGRVEVLGVTLGKTTVEEAARLFLADPEISVFERRDGSMSLEAYFGKVTMDGLTGEITALIQTNNDFVVRVRERPVKKEPAPSGDLRYTLGSGEFAEAFVKPVVALTYVPSVNLDDDMVAKRFGPPDRKIKTGGAVHWLYPAKGVDVIVNAGGKDVIQYVTPEKFGSLEKPLEQR